MVEPSRSVQVSMQIPPDLPTRYATNFLVQRTDSDVVVTFFEARVPVFVGTEAEKTAQIASLTNIPSVCVARIVMTPDRAAELFATLATNYENHAAKKIQAKKGKG